MTSGQTCTSCRSTVQPTLRKKGNHYMSTLTRDQLLAKTIYLTQENNRLREELLDAHLAAGTIRLDNTEDTKEQEADNA